MKAVEASGLHKSYSGVEALRGVSFEVEPGVIYGILGPDGAGKSSIFRILSTLILPDKGSAAVMGHDVVREYRKVRQIVGYMPGRFSLYQDLSVEENINFFATLFGTTLKENYHLIKDIYSQIEPFKKRKAGALSGGMKQKLALSCALIHKPDVLFLDEPTTGVDPVSRKEFWGMLSKLAKNGLAIVVSTPYMDEATLCDRVSLIRKGIFLDTDTPGRIVDKFDRVLLSAESSRMPALLRDIRSLPEVFSCFAFGDRHHLVLKTPEEGGGGSLQDTIAGLSLRLREMGHSDVLIEPITPCIEDCYMYLDKMDRENG